jgi:transposase
MCQAVKEDHGDSIIYLDGAGYHKQTVNKVPTGSSRKQVMIDWLKSVGAQVPENATKDVLYVIVKQLKAENTRYKVKEIGAEFGHQVFFTPPYHPELNPIEKIWAALKNPVSTMSGTRTMEEVGSSILEVASSLEAKTWMGSWAATHDYLRQYASEVIEDCSESEAESDEDEAE